MDLNTVTQVRLPSTREDLVLAPGERFLGGGTLLYAEQDPAVTGLVDLMALGWTPLQRRDGGLRIAATCTLAQLAAIGPELGGTAHPLFRQTAESLLASFKIWNTATVGGNLCFAAPASPVTGLVSVLDASIKVWRPDGSKRRIPAADFVTGPLRIALEPGELVRAIDIPAHALSARTAHRKIALQPLGRSGIVVFGRHDLDGTFVVCATASTPRPYVFRFASPPTAEELAARIDGEGIEWYTDAHGAADWRHAMTLRLAEEIRQELSA